MTERMISEHFNVDGKPKRLFGNWYLAKQEALKQCKQAYRCGFCGGLHIGGYSARGMTRKFN